MNMKRIFAGILAIGLAFVPGLTGCKAIPAERVDTAIVIGTGVRSNSPDMSTELLEDALWETAYGYSTVTIITVEGEPCVRDTITVKAPNTRVDETKHKQLARNGVSKIRKVLYQAKAETEEADVLTAITLGADSLSNSDASKKKLIVLDSMLSTAGLMNFSSSQLLYEDPETIANELAEKHALPDLNGVDVVVYGMGQTADNQKKLTFEMKFRLQTIWETIFSASNVNDLKIVKTPLPIPDQNRNLPYVSSVPVIEEIQNYDTAMAPSEGKNESVETVSLPTPINSEVVSTACNEPTEQVDIPEILRLDDKSVEFIPNTAEFLNQEAASETLHTVADILGTSKDAKIIIAGMTATTGDAQICRELSYDRALAVADILKRQGVSADRMRCIGLGYDACFLRTNDLDVYGNLTTAAQRNRCVWIISEESESAKLLERQVVFP